MRAVAAVAHCALMRVDHEASRKQALQLLRIDRVVHEERVRPPLVVHEAEWRL